MERGDRESYFNDFRESDTNEAYPFYTATTYDLSTASSETNSMNSKFSIS